MDIFFKVELVPWTDKVLEELLLIDFLRLDDEAPSDFSFPLAEACE